MTRITKTMCLAQLTETDADLYVCDDPKPRKCVGNCKKLYTPTHADISTRHPSVYWNQCENCREYLKQRGKIYMENKSFHKSKLIHKVFKKYIKK